MLASYKSQAECHNLFPDEFYLHLSKSVESTSAWVDTHSARYTDIQQNSVYRLTYALFREKLLPSLNQQSLIISGKGSIAFQWSELDHTNFKL